MPLNRSRPNITQTDRSANPTPGTGRASARRLSPRLISDAVVAGYLHDISQRHRRRVRVPERAVAADA